MEKLMKKVLAVVVSAVVCMGASMMNVNAADALQNTKQMTISDPEKIAYSKDSLKIYDDILRMYYHYISTEWMDYPDIYEVTYGVCGLTLDNVSYLWYRYNKEAGLSNAGYQFVDINGDDTDELIVGVIDSYTGEEVLYDLYTMHNNEIVHLAASGERDWFYVGKDYEISESGSTGAVGHVDIFYHITDGKLTAYEEYEYDGNSDPDNPYFYADECTLVSTEYGEYYDFTNRKHITEEEYNTMGGHTNLTLNLTPFSEYSTNTSTSNTIGDLNSDTKINASDAAMVLIAAASIGAGSDSGLTPEQETAADVNGDTKVNASDAAIILQYVAAYGAGYTGTLEDFMNGTEMTDDVQYTYGTVLDYKPDDEDLTSWAYIMADILDDGRYSLSSMGGGNEAYNILKNYFTSNGLPEPGHYIYYVYLG